MPAITLLKRHASKERAVLNARFFKTGKGQYGEGDRFLGVTVPNTRIVAKQFRDLPMNDVKKLLASPWHEVRLLALIIWTMQFQRGDEKKRKEIFDAYLASTKHINNWDLVDTSAGVIVGELLSVTPSPAKERVGVRCAILKKLAKSKSLWERRIAIVATFAFIRRGESELTFTIADLVMNDREDLMHKATGWMLREVGKRCGRGVLIDYLKPRYKTMPRTMLRYAIEHFSAVERKRWLLGKF